MTAPVNAPTIDTLEFRTLFTATIADIEIGNADVLRITSNDAADVVTCSLFDDEDNDDNPSPGDNEVEFIFTINGVDSESFEISEYDRIEFIGNGGADSFILGNVLLPLLASGGKGHDTISASTGDDTLYGDGGEDYLFGDSGDDVLTGGLQGDELIGREGDDTIHGGSSNATDDIISGGAGYDIANFFEGATGRVKIEVGRTEPGSDVSDVVHGDVEEIFGTQFDDIIGTIAGKPIKINGSAGVDRLYGGSKNDTLIGGTGSDYLYGNGGDDLLDAGGTGGGVDRLFGGTGTDRVIGRTGNDVLDSVETIG